MKIHVLVLSLLLQCSLCRDFYVGMFKKDDLLVAYDTLYKAKVSRRLAYAKYGRLFNCSITYFRVVDRLGVGRTPKVQIIRGGLRKKYLALRLISGYDLPLSVNIYVGCENKLNFTRSTYIVKTTTEPSTNIIKTTNTIKGGNTDKADDVSIVQLSNVNGKNDATSKNNATDDEDVPNTETTISGSTEASSNAPETTPPQLARLKEDIPEIVAEED